MLTSAELVWLLAAVAKGDDVAFERLYAATRAKLYGVVIRILRHPDLAEEVMLEAYRTIWRGAGQFDPALSSPISWMATIARNRAVDLARNGPDVSAADEPEALAAAADGPNPPARRELNEPLKRLLACIGQLEPERQRLVLLAYYNGWSRDRLARELGMPVNTIKVWLRSSLIEIRGCSGS